MDESTLRTLIDDLTHGRIHADDAVVALRRLPFADLGDATIDHHRALRQGRPEAVYAPGKTPDQCVRIVGELLAHGTGPVVLSRSDEAQRETLDAAHPGSITVDRTVVWRMPSHHQRRPESVVICSGGTADLPVVREAEITLQAYGFAPTVLVDIGVAGLHRLLRHVDTLVAAHAVIVVAGMEAALGSVVSGLTGAPVVAVPTSVGYGSSLEGVTALLGLTASCASGMTVVGIDNGFGAACAVARMFPARSAS